MKLLQGIHELRTLLTGIIHMPDAPLLACTRMYNATETVAALWESFVHKVATCSGVPLVFDRYAFPQDIELLWQRTDLGLTFICGRAFALGGQKHIPIAAPVRKVNNAPLYHTNLLVRKDSPLTTLQESFGTRLGWTVSHSHSGYLAVKKLLKPFQDNHKGSLYAEEIGPLHTPAKCLDALLNNEIDVAPLDAYYYDLLLLHAPEKLKETKILAATAEYPIPFLVASPGTPQSVCERLRDGVKEAQASPAGREIISQLGLAGFTAPETARYHILGDT